MTHFSAIVVSALILGLHYWDKETHFLKTNIYILTSTDRANDVNAADACMVQPFLSVMSTSSNSKLHQAMLLPGQLQVLCIRAFIATMLAPTIPTRSV